MKTSLCFILAQIGLFIQACLSFKLGNILGILAGWKKLIKGSKI